MQPGVPRFTFGLPELLDGISFVALAMGMFGIAEIIRNLERRGTRARSLKTKVDSLCPTGRIQARHPARAARHGAGLRARHPAGRRRRRSAPSRPTRWRRRSSKDPHVFGTGAIEGVAGPEAANNAAAQTSFIPLLTLGIPSNAVMALMIGALIIQGIQPGPR